MHAVELINRCLFNGKYLQRMLGGRGLVGLALMLGFYSGDPWMTAQQIAEKSEMSEDTVRRRMTDLLNAGRASVRDDRGRKMYAINPETARQILTRLAEREPGEIEVPDAPQDATASCGDTPSQPVHAPVTDLQCSNES